MKKILLIVLLSIVVQPNKIMLAGMGKSEIQTAKSYPEEMYVLAQTFQELAKPLLPPEKQKHVDLIADLLIDSYIVMEKSIRLSNEIKQFEARAKQFKNQINCIKQSNFKAHEMCNAIDCPDKRACIAAMLREIKNILTPLIDNLLGTMVTAPDGTRYLEQGILITLANLNVLPEEKRKLYVQKLKDYTTRLITALDIVNLTAFIINPVLKPAVELTPAQIEDIKKEEPIEIPQDEEFNFDEE